MKTLNALFILLALFCFKQARADNQFVDTMIGATVGGGGARALCHNCNTRHRNMATAVGALGGAWVGSTVGDDSERRYQQNRVDRGYAQPVYEEQRSYPVQRVQAQPVTTYVEEPVRPVRVIREERAPQMDDCDEEYFRGKYNPELAQAYCKGRRDRIMQAYNDGLSGR